MFASIAYHPIVWYNKLDNCGEGRGRMDGIEEFIEKISASLDSARRHIEEADDAEEKPAKKPAAKKAAKTEE